MIFQIYSFFTLDCNASPIVSKTIVPVQGNSFHLFQNLLVTSFYLIVVTSDLITIFIWGSREEDYL